MPSMLMRRTCSCLRSPRSACAAIGRAAAIAAAVSACKRNLLAIVPSPWKVLVAPSTGFEERAYVLVSARHTRVRSDHEHRLTIVFQPPSYDDRMLEQGHSGAR